MPEKTILKRIINPFEETTLNAGQFETNSRNPDIILKLDYPASIKELVTWREEIVGEPGKLFRILNQSNFLVYASLVKQMTA